MKKVVLIIFFFLTTIIIIAQNKEEYNVAVFDPYVNGITDSTTIKKVVREKLIEILVNTGLYTLVERGDIQKVFQETDIQNKGEIKDEDIVKLGKKAGAKYVCYASITSLGSKYFISCKFTEVESAKIIFHKTGKIDTDIEKIPNKIELLVGNMFIHLRKTAILNKQWPAGKWVNQKWDKIFILFKEDSTGVFIGDKDGYNNSNLKWSYKGNVLIISVRNDGYKDIIDAWNGIPKNVAKSIFNKCNKPYKYIFKDIKKGQNSLEGFLEYKNSECETKSEPYTIDYEPNIDR